MNALRLKLWLALLFVLCTVAIPGLIARHALNVVRAQSARAEASAQVLSAFQRLTVLGYTLHQEKMTDPQAFAKDFDLYIDGVRSHTTSVERYIDKEIRLTEQAPLSSLERDAHIAEDLRQRELARQIGARLERSLKDQPDSQWENPAFKALKGEEREAREFQRGALGTFESVTTVLSWTFAIAVIVGLLGVIWGQRQVIRPLSNLWRGTRAMAEGHYSERVQIAGTTEFRTIAESFNTMASRVEQASDTMRQTNEELERAVIRRTTELAATHRSLERANRLRQQFLADASHELRTPLSVMRSEAEITLRKADAGSGDLRAGLDRVARLSALMAEMIDDMLHVARAEEPMLQTTIAPLDVVAAVRSCVEDFHRLIDTDEGKIAIIETPVSLKIESDQHRLQQVIRIVVDNAVCYSTLPPHVEIAIHQDDDTALLVIADKGDGIAPEDIPHLFQRFRRGAKRPGKGHGLGLSIARSITEALGGTISLESKLHEGTTVSIRLPLLSEPEMADATLA